VAASAVGIAEDLRKGSLFIYLLTLIKPVRKTVPFLLQKRKKNWRSVLDAGVAMY
jgi:hypothetical protein